MSTSAAPLECCSPEYEALRAVVEEELRICRALLAASEAVQHAVTFPLDLEALEAAVRRRSAELQALEEVEARARSLRVAELVPDEELTRDLELLQSSIRRVRDADELARRAAKRGMEEMRQEIRGVNAGREALRHYRGPVEHPPRFANKRG